MVDSSKTCPIKMNRRTLFTCVYMGLLLLQGTDAASLDKYTKIYKVKGETRICLKRDQLEACPLDHDIGACHSNMTQVSCNPCDIKKGYRLCMQVYSDIDYVTCYKLDLDCRPEEELIIHTHPDGSCYDYECRCRAGDGYVKRGLECIHLGQPCAVNFTVINGSCQACPAGTHKPTVGFEPCSPHPVSPTPPTALTASSITESVANLTANSSIDEGSRSQGGTTPGRQLDVETDKPATTIGTTRDDRGNHVRWSWLLIIPVSVMVVILVVAIITIRNNMRGIRINFKYCCICLGTFNHYEQTTTPQDQVNSSPSVPRETTGEGPDHEDRPSSPPTYRSSDVPAKIHFNPDSASIGSNRDSNLEPAEVNQPLIEATEPSEQEVNPPPANTSDLSLSVSFPTLATRGGSSLLQNGAARRAAADDSREALIDPDNTERVQVAAPHAVPAAALGPMSAQEGFGEVDDRLDQFDFGSSFSIIS